MVEALLGKYLWTLDAAVVCLCATLLGLSASGLVESRYLSLPRVPRAAHAAPVSPPAAAHGKQPDAILRRNIFCSACPPILLDGDADPSSQSDDEPADPQPTSLPLKLVAVMFSPSPEQQSWNMAVIRDNDHKTIGAFGVGAEIHQATLLSILDTRVYLDNAGAMEFLDLLSPPKGSPPPAPAPRSTPRPTPPRDALTQALDRGIKKVGERRYEVQRSTLESVMGNLSLLSRSARIVPVLRDGKAYGFRLHSVRPNGPFAKIGLRNGDVIVSINGLEMTTPEKSLEVYSKLKSASHVALGLERSGKKVSQDYTIR
ncbi:MAG: PDZ domain-containing protein [Deltaproteobacteria bacterium]|nr:PDZ domain-containing protein [Deltaproteobacteria bacterium]